MVKSQRYGASSSTAEHRTVDAGVVGSKPIWHPDNEWLEFQPFFIDYFKAFAIAAMCAGVLPQHAPINFAPLTFIFNAKSAIISGVPS
jgi:hypothetical protein